MGLRAKLPNHIPACRSEFHTGCPKKNAPLWFCFITPSTSSLQSWDISQTKGDIHMYVLSTDSFLCDIGEPRYKQNNTGYHIIKIVKHRLKPYYFNLIPCIVLPISRLPDIARRIACTQNVPISVTLHLSTSSLLCNIVEL